jgi:hypothetical protein
VSLAGRLSYALGDVLIYGPLRNVLGFSRIRVAYTAGEAIGPDLFQFYRSLGVNLKQLYGSTETSVFVCIQPDGQVKPDSVGTPATVSRSASPARARQVQPGVFQLPPSRGRHRRGKTPDGFSPATPASSTRTGTSRSSTGRATWVASATGRSSPPNI